MPVIFHELSPAPLLADFVRCYWYMELGEQAVALKERIVPDGCAEIIFHLGATMYRTDMQGTTHYDPAAKLNGQPTVPYFVHAAGPIRMFGIRFFPHTMAALLRLSAHHTVDGFIDLEAILGAPVRYWQEQLLSAADIGIMAAYTDALLLPCLRSRQDSKSGYVAYAVQQIIRAGGNLQLKALLGQLGISSKYLNTIFAEQVGLTPKMFVHIVRLQHFLSRLQSKDSLTSQAYAAGYYDQAHAIRTFRAFTGTTPSAYQREQQVVSAPFITSSNSSFLYNSTS